MKRNKIWMSSPSGGADYVLSLVGGIGGIVALGMLLLLGAACLAFSLLPGPSTERCVKR